MSSGQQSISNPLTIAEGGTGSATAANARTALGLAIGTDVQAYDADLGALAAQSQTNTFPVRTGAGTISETSYVEGTFTPTVTLVGGAGNTVPVYTTNTGRYTRIGNRVFAQVVLSGDGGAEGAGTGEIAIALPFTASASMGELTSLCGRLVNGGNEYWVVIFISPSATTLGFKYMSSFTAGTPATGDLQNGTDRQIRLTFDYEV